ncbi:MAG TPA: DUF6675 family protein [Usitatibacter sp.]|nr:DUF6675 family protein [Usitatibacter sp.]
MKLPAPLFVALLLAAPRVQAEAALPDDLCDAKLPPVAPTADGEPGTQTWSNVQWDPPQCLGWPSGKYRLVVELAGRIENVDETELRRRLGAISELRGTRYWSVTEGAWRELITEASALAGPGGEARADFAPAEIRRDATLFFSQTDNRSSKPVAYSMKVVDASPGRIVVETANDSPIESMMLTLFPPGSLHAAYVLTRTAPRSWSFHALSATTGEASGLVSLSKASYINRAKALFAHLAGIPI